MNERAAVRLFTLRVLVVSLLLALFGRLWYVQVLSGDQYSKAATTTLAHHIITTATRGEILDDWGRAYAENKTALVISVNWLQLQDQPDNGYAVETRLAALLHEDVRGLIDSITPCNYAVNKKTHKRVPGSAPTPPGCYSGQPYQPIPVTDKADTEQALEILERADQYPGVTAAVQSIRQYESPLGSVAANLIGYEGRPNQQQIDTGQYDADALVGASGIEEQYESALRGTDGDQAVSVDAAGNTTSEISDTPTVPGDNVVTSIDAGVQGLLEGVLAKAVTQIAPSQKTDPNNPSAGPTFPTQAAGVVVNAQTGEIVASASYPSYNPKYFEFPRSDADNAAIAALNTNPAHPLLNQAIQGQYAPGSSFKLITTSAELNTGVANWSSQYECPGALLVGGKPKSNSEGEALGKIDLRTTIAQSCDTVYYGFALQDYGVDYNRVVKQHLPANESVTKMAKLFGLDAPTGVDLPSEAKGLVQTWDETKSLAQFYLAQECLGAHGGTDPKTHKKIAPNKDKAKRAADSVACAHGLASYDEILYPGNYADEYIGQGTVLATPLQMAMAYAALVNGGKVYSPRVAKAIVKPDGQLVKTIKPVVQRVLPVTPENLADIEQAMYDVNTVGTAKAAFQGFPMKQLLVGGKTGTAQVEDAQTKKITDTSVFASFAGKPGQPPQYVSIIIVPKGGYGADVAAPATRLLWDGMFGLEGHANVMPKGLLAGLPQFSADGNITTKAPLIAPGVPVPSATPSTGVSGATSPTSTPPATTPTTPAAPTTGGSSTSAKAIGPLTPTGAGTPTRVVAFGASGRAPPAGPAA